MTQSRRQNWKTDKWLSFYLISNNCSYSFSGSSQMKAPSFQLVKTPNGQKVQLIQPEWAPLFSIYTDQKSFWISIFFSCLKKEQKMKRYEPLINCFQRHVWFYSAKKTPLTFFSFCYLLNSLWIDRFIGIRVPQWVQHGKWKTFLDILPHVSTQSSLGNNIGNEAKRNNMWLFHWVFLTASLKPQLFRNLLMK